MTSPILKFGIVGCGVIAPTHARSIAELPNAQLTAVCDIVEEKARALAELYPSMNPLNPGEVQVFTGIEEMFAQAEIDVVCVCTPSGAHAEVGIAAARAGKHVITEKPMDVTLAKARALIEACQSAGVTLAVISQHRFDPPIRALKNAICEGKLGQLNFCGSHTKWYRVQSYYDSGDWRGTWALDGGGALINQSIHYVDLLSYMMGPVAEISAYTATRAHERIEVEDIAVAAVKFRSGALGIIEGSTLAYPGFEARLDVYGTEGSVIIVNDRVKEWALRSGETYASEDGPTSFIGGTSSHDIWHHSHRREIEDVIQAIQQRRPPLVTGEEGYRALQIVLGVYQSAKEGKPVKIGG